MTKEQIKLIETLLSYANMLDDSEQTEKFQKQLGSASCNTYDNYYRALNDAREILESNK
jgi:hypothetical protein